MTKLNPKSTHVHLDASALTEGPCQVAGCTSPKTAHHHHRGLGRVMRVACSCVRGLSNGMSNVETR